MAILLAATNLLLATMVLCAVGQSRGLEADKRTPVHLGIVIVYDQEFHEQIIDAQRFHQLSRKGFDEYFAALLKAVELRFHHVKGVLITLTLITHYKRPGVAANADSYSLDGGQTMKNLELELKENSYLYTKADIVVFVTGKEVRTVANKSEWIGVAEKAQVCTETKKVALISDNGKTFTGAEQMTLQLALLLNASRDGIDNSCNASEYFLLSSIYGGFKYQLSPCSEKDMVSFLTTTEKGCWTDEVADRFHGVLPATYHNETGYDICSVHHRNNRDIKTCKATDSEPKRNKTCGVQCCDYYRLRSPFLYMQTAADGTECGERKICVDGQCVELQTLNSALL